MAETFVEYVYEIGIHSDHCRVDLNELDSRIDNILNHYQANEDHLAIYDIKRAFEYTRDAIAHLIGAEWPGAYGYHIWNAFKLSCDYTGTCGGVTWQAICEAWVKSDFEGKEWTIACIDHMRTLMWDKPFSIKWAAKPIEEKE